MGSGTTRTSIGPPKVSYTAALTADDGSEQPDPSGAPRSSTATLGHMENDTITLSSTAVDEAVAAEIAVEDELLVEEISIDGMCGVY